MESDANITLQSYSSQRQVDLTCFRRVFDRRNLPLTKPSDFEAFMASEHYLSVKQAPSALLLKNSGSHNFMRNRELFHGLGFPIREIDSEGTITSHQKKEVRKTLSDYSFSTLTSLLNEAVHGEPYQEPIPEKAIPRKKPKVVSLDYEDPWKIHAYLAYCSEAGIQPPKVNVSFSDGFRLQDSLPPRLLGPRWKGSKKNSIGFLSIGDIDAKMHLIDNHTFWGSALRKLCFSTVPSERNWANFLRKRVRALLLGKPDPLWSKRVTAQYWADTKYRPGKARSARLIEVLKTVDGLFMQRYISYPEEQWSWSRYDSFVLTNLSQLIGDEFFDGSLTKLSLGKVTAYSQLKSARKLFKRLIHKEGVLKTEDAESLPPWLRQFIPLWRDALKQTNHRRAFLGGLLSGTRGSGTPPPLVLLQSKRKFLTTVQKESPKPSPTEKALVRTSMQHVLDNMPQEAFTGLSTKSRITVSTAASWENTRKEGGTLQTISDIVSMGDVIPVPIRDLDTGREIEFRLVTEFDSPGEYIFWACLDEVLRTPPEELTNAFLTVVKEPGKARSVTKARASLKIVLDLVSKLCSEPLKKGIPSSRSGMGASHHAWEFFKTLMSKDFEDDLFSLLDREDETFADFSVRTDIYEDLFVSSTDYEEATDQMQHWVAFEIGKAWMHKCGIPRLLQGIVNRSCYKPRKIFFRATGGLEEIGEPGPEGTRFVWLRQGVLMGDPLTKVSLHFVNIVTRDIANNIDNIAWLEKGFSNSAEISSSVSEIFRERKVVTR